MGDSQDSGDDWFKRRRTVWDKFFEDIFKEMEEMDKLLSEYESIPPEDRAKIRVPLTWGFEYEIGPDGKPIRREFGNVKRKGIVPRIGEETEPLTDVVEKDDSISVVVELPGVEKENIGVSCDGKVVKIEAKSEKRKYSREIPLPAEVIPKSGVARYKNGILDLTLKKRTTSAPSGEHIKVE